MNKRCRAALEKKRRQLNGLDDLPIEIAVAIEQHAPAPEKAKPASAPDSAEDLVQRLIVIRERLFWLQAVWATTLGRDVALEIDKYRRLFQDLGEQLTAKDREAFDGLVVGHEALLLSESAPVKSTIPIETQRNFELLDELRARPTIKSDPKPDGYVPDGLQGLL